MKPATIRCARRPVPFSARPFFALAWIAGLLVTFLALAPAARARASEAAGIFPFPPVVRDLDNGLRAVLIETPYPEIVSVHITVLAGSRDEVEEGKSGFAHFFEHMMFRGTENVSAEEYGAILKRAGADQNAYTTDDYTNYHVTFSKDDLDTVLRLEADRFRNLAYSVDQFKTEARAVLGEYNKNYADPIRKFLEVQRDRVFRKHTYEHTTMGFLEDIEDMPNEYEYSRRFYERFYRPGNTVVSVVGDIDVDATFAMIEKHFGPWQPGGTRPEIPTEPPQDGPITEHVSWPSPTLPWVAVGFRGPEFSTASKDMACMDLVSNLLFSESSDLYRKLVVENRMVDQIFPYFPDRKDPYLVTVFARVVAPEFAQTVRDEILATFRAARTEPLDPSRVERVKANLKYSFVGSLDSSEAIADVLARYVHFDRDPGTIDALYALYDTITSSDILDAARRTFVDSGVHVMTLGHEPLPGDWDRVPSVETGTPDSIAAGIGDADADATSRTAGAGAAEGSDGAVLLPNDSPLVNFRFVFDAGAADDPSGREGLAALTAAMITDAGSRDRTYAEIQEAFFPMAASFGAQVDKEMTTFVGAIHRDHLGPYTDLILGQLLRPAWREDDFDRVKRNLVNSIRVDLVGNNDEELGKEVLYQELYRGHPYGHLNLGHVATLEAATLDDCRDFYAKHYTRAALTLGLAGGFDDAFRSRLEKALADLPSGSGAAVGANATANAKADATVPQPDGWKMTIVEKNTRATGLHWGFPIEVDRAHPDFTALWLVRSWLGEHRSSNSHLYQRIREVRGMNYGDYAYIEYFPRGMFQFQPDPNLARDSQIFQVWIRPVAPENAEFALRISLFEFQKMLERGLSQEDFEATRDYLSKYVNLLVKTQDRQLGYAIDSRWYGIGAFAPKIREELEALTLEQVNAAMRRHLQMDDIRFVAVAPDGEALRDRLLSGKPSTMRYDGEKPKALLDEDAVIHRYPLRFAEGDVTVVDADAVFAGSR